MKKAWIIAWKDFKTYFTSPIAYVVTGMFLLIMGIMFFSNLSHFNMMNMQSKQFNAGKGVSITDGILRPTYGNMNVIFLFMVPFITMRLFAEERKNQTIVMLMTAPIRLWELVVGKFLSCFMLIVVIYSLTLFYPFVLFLTANPDPGTVFATFIGTFLMVSCYISIGVMWSSTTENQIVAAALTLFTILLFWIISWPGQYAGNVTREILNYLSLISHFNDFSQGAIKLSDCVFYLSFTGVCLFLTHRILDSYRWR